jgi:5-methylcytosine-specific restriction endonuclease McrBC regulatory subunit McrC
MYGQVVEYGPAAILNLTDAQVLALRGASARWGKALRLSQEPLEIEVLSQGVAVRARDVAGFVRVGDLSLDVIPKFLDPTIVGSIWRRSLWRFLAFAQGIDSISVTTSGLEVDERGVADLLADLFVASVDSATLMGYPLGYETQRRLSQFMCGRIDTRRISRLALPDGKLPIETRRLTRNTEIGQLLKWAANELARLVETPERRGRLRAWTAGLPEVADGPPRTVRNVATARQFPHLTVAVDIALMLLADHWGEYGHGSLNLPGFLWRSETLFEKAMLRLARKSAHRLGMTADKRSHPLASEAVNGVTRVLSTTPDIDVHQAGSTCVLLDAKYKVLGGTPSVADLYQVLSGGRACGADRVALLYPNEGSGLSVRTLVPLGAGNPLRVDLISVGLSSFEALSSLRQLIAELTSWIGGSRSANHDEAHTGP